MLTGKWWKRDIALLEVQDSRTPALTDDALEDYKCHGFSFDIEIRAGRLFWDPHLTPILNLGLKG